MCVLTLSVKVSQAKKVQVTDTNMFGHPGKSSNCCIIYFNIIALYYCNITIYTIYILPKTTYFLDHSVCALRDSNGMSNIAK